MSKFGCYYCFKETLELLNETIKCQRLFIFAILMKSSDLMNHVCLMKP